MVQVSSTILSLAAIVFFEYGSILPGNYFIKTAVRDLKRQLSHCSRTKDGDHGSFTDPLLGHFAPRHLNCPFPTCAPEHPSAIRTHFIFKSQSQVQDLTISADQMMRSDNTQLLAQVAKYLQSDRVAVLIHGWTQSFRYAPELNETASALNNLGKDVIAVDWSHGAVDLYVGTLNNQVVGAQVAFLLQSLSILDKTECIGFSMGANVCGYAGQWLKERGYQSLARCTGLDPSPFYLQGCPDNLMLSRDDCDVVAIIHTSSAPFHASLGSDVNQGDCDFWMRYREDHDGCSRLDTTLSVLTNSSIIHSDKLYNQLANLIGCNHLTALRFYIQQATSYPDIKFKFRECSNRYQSRYCDDDEVSWQPFDYIHPMPPFDTCMPNDSKLFCLCV